MTDENDPRDRNGSTPESMASNNTAVSTKSIKLRAVEPYTFYIHTGCNNPALEKTEKWEDGRMSFIINPHSERASVIFYIKEQFPANRESHVKYDKYLPCHVGVPQQLKIDLESHRFEIIKEALYIREVSVIYKGDTYRFPVNDYLYPHNPIHNPDTMEHGCPPHIITRAGKGTLLAEEQDPAIIAARVEGVRIRKKLLDWADNDGEYCIPGYIRQTVYNKLPRFLQFKNARQEAFQLNLKRGHNMVKWTVIENKFRGMFGKKSVERLDSLDAFKDILLEQAEEYQYDKGMVAEVLKVTDVWREDEEFGRQVLQGINPTEIRRCRQVPSSWDNMPALPDMILLPGSTLQSECEAGNVYIIDTNLLKGLPDGGRLMPMLTGFDLPMIVCVAECLFWCHEGALKPIAIRLEYQGGEPTYWFPPPPGTSPESPEAMKWLLAKMYFKSSDTQIHAVLTHFTASHALVEPFAVAMYRCLPAQHPIYKLLLPHLNGVIPIDVQGRMFLTSKAGVMSALMAAGDNLWQLSDAYMQTFTYDKFNPRKGFEKRDVMDLPGYHYRTDALSYLDALTEYVHDVLALSYTTDGAIINDEELLEFITEVREKGFGRVPGNAQFPSALTSLPELVEYVTLIMWNASVFHASVNFGQFYYLAFVPNSPCAMVRPPPAQDAVVSMQDVLESLPVAEMVRVQIDISYSLSLFSPVEKFYLGSIAEDKLGLSHESIMVADEEVECMDRLTARLKGLQKEIRARGQGAKIAYDRLRPDCVPLTVQT